MDKKLAVVTGGTSGIGLAVAEKLARKGFNVIVASKSHSDKLPKGVTFERLDLSDKASIREFAHKIRKIDYLICNAGTMMPERQEFTNYGVDMQFGVNYLGHFRLIIELLPVVKKCNTRIVTTSSIAAWSAKFQPEWTLPGAEYRPYQMYAMSKLCCLMLAKVLADKGLNSVAVHPGLARSGLFSRSRHPFVVFSRIGTALVGQTTRGAAETVAFAALSSKTTPGGFYGPRWVFFGKPHSVRPPRIAKNPKNLKDLWNFSRKMLKSS